MVPVAFLLLLFAPAEDYLADAQKALAANQPAAAEPLLRKAIEQDAGDFGAHFNLALALSLQRKDAEAITELGRVLTLKPGLYEADLNLGILLLRNNRAADALNPLKEAVAAKPAELRPHLYLAQAFFDSGDPVQAELHYNIVVAADPKSAPAQLGLARSLLEQAKLAEAAERFRAAGLKDGLLEVAAAYEQAGRKAEAISIYREFPDNPEVREHLGRMLTDNGDAHGAIADLEEAVRRAPTRGNRLALADAYKLDRQNVKMIEQLRLASAAGPRDYDLRMSLGRALRDERSLVPAAEQFRAAAKIKPDSAAAWNELASVLIVDLNYAEGLAALDQVRRLGKEIPGDFFLRAITLDKLKQFPQALAAYGQFLASDNGAHPDQEFQARQRSRIIEAELKKK
ncbi:MAG: tetratricopeptide repeat protein [Terriglobia bacterium]